MVSTLRWRDLHKMDKMEVKNSVPYSSSVFSSVAVFQAFSLFPHDFISLSKEKSDFLESCFASQVF